ncbi:MAG: hypothetical protein JOZ99_09220 [Actinobacteria bacterium]|nr:hypothetical protein [Actinomycetota bacterium]
MTDGQTVHVVVRVWLPDRPGALGQVASRIGAMRGDIVGVEVLERSGTVAVDEFAVDLPSADLVPLLVREVEEVDGASVEEVEQVDRFPDPRLDALQSVERLCVAEKPRDVPALLARECCAEFLAEWGAVLISGALAASTGAAPDVDVLVALATGTAASPLVASGESGPDDLAVAALTDHDAIVLVGRARRPFRKRERAQLLAVARIADRVWGLLE